MQPSSRLLVPLLVGTVLCIPARTLAQEPVPRAAAPDDNTLNEIDRIFNWATTATPGCVTAASHRGQIVVNRAYGRADLERDVPLSADSLFDAASIRKQFVAAAIFLLVEEGRLSLADDVRTHVPELPDYGHTITLEHLLTHTSGLRDWIPLQDWANGSDAAMTLILRQRTLNFAPGAEWSYSNSGYVLLTEIVVRTSGMTFPEFARKRFFDPLGMKSTVYVDDLRDVIRNRALAYEPEGNTWKLAMRIGIERGGGALFSTARDLVLWTDALANRRLGRFVTEKLEEPARLGNGRTLGYSRGLLLGVNYAGRMMWHGGGAAGYRSILARYPDQALSIAVLCNAGERSDDRDAFAARIHDLLVSPAGRPTPPAPPASPAVHGLDVNGKVGLFFSERTDEPLRLIASNGRLAVAGSGPLVAVTPDRFRAARASLAFMSQDEFELNFLSPDQFELKTMEGATTRYRRARFYAPGAADLQTFAGRYESDELKAVMQIAPGKGNLTASVNESQGIELAPVDPDTFQRGTQALVRFRRDAAGKVVGFDFTNPAFRNVRFTRRDSAEPR
jgi:CubicO group peptidase (beta-lactamase class C family)